MATSSKSYFLTKLTSCKELNRKPNLFLLNDRPLLVPKEDDDTRCSLGTFLGNSLRAAMQRPSGLRIYEHSEEGHVLVMSTAS